MPEDDRYSTRTPRKPIAVGDVIDGWTVNALNGADVVLVSGHERRTWQLDDLERHREAVAPVKVGDVIDDFTVIEIRSAEEVLVVARVATAPDGERRRVTLPELQRAKLAAATRR